MVEIIKSRDPFVRVSGIFYRAVSDSLGVDPMAGSVAAGRYSRPSQRTLYMSSSEEGVTAAMHAHPVRSGENRLTWPLMVDADRIADLRDDAIFQVIRMQREDALRPWQEGLAKGDEPTSWAVRAALESMGAAGLIDPSRKAPGLWHLVLFHWNKPNTPSVEVLT